ncbi:MAG TPA: hypothetical protein VMU16_01890 [Candidatus Binataceae bacterium]|nr:hypothetical protein [Candidatus Binataceae bacterium]
MTWAAFYLTCFIVGTALSVLSFLGGHFHFPHVHLHVPHGHVPVPHGIVASHGGAGHGAEASYFNFATFTIFLVWSGGAGYLATRYSPLAETGIIIVAIAAGLIGSAILFALVIKPLLEHDRALDPAHYERVGSLGRVSSPIAAAGTGEIIFSLAGTRQTCGARSDGGAALDRGTEVIITRYEHGIAYVRRWDEFADRRIGVGATDTNIESKEAHASHAKYTN